ncbi:hypothetical protein H8959_014856 [Pygathrix nigripes]
MLLRETLPSSIEQGRWQSCRTGLQQPQKADAVPSLCPDRCLGSSALGVSLTDDGVETQRPPAGGMPWSWEPTELIQALGVLDWRPACRLQ